MGGRANGGAKWDVSPIPRNEDQVGLALGGLLRVNDFAWMPQAMTFSTDIAIQSGPSRYFSMERNDREQDQPAAPPITQGG